MNRERKRKSVRICGLFFSCLRLPVHHFLLLRLHEVARGGEGREDLLDEGGVEAARQAFGGVDLQGVASGIGEAG